ncbi:MAG: hypothetical protein WC824_05990 [Bacteroidota bacterium]
MAKETAYFIAAGKSLAGADRYRSDFRKAGETQSDFAQEFGCSAWVVEKSDDGNCLSGLTFEITPDPKLWRHYIKSRDPKVYCPNRATKEGKALVERIDQLQAAPTEWQLINYVMPPQDRKNCRVWDLGNKKVYPRCNLEFVEGSWIIKVNFNGDDPPLVAPMGAKPIKESEYLKMKEKQA